MTEAELRDWGHRFGRSAHPPLVVTISGELGAGKTTLVQAICEGYGVTDEVTSPTFALVHEYEAPRSPVLSSRSVSPRPPRPARRTRLGRDRRARALVLDRVAGARRRPAARRARDARRCSISPTIPDAGCCTRDGTRDHARARRVDVRGKRGAAATATRCSPSASVAMRGREHEALMPAVRRAARRAGRRARRDRPRRLRRRPGQLHEPAHRRRDREGDRAGGGAVRSFRSRRSRSLVASREPFEPGRYLAVVDALRGEHYVGLFEVDAMPARSRALGAGAPGPVGRGRCERARRRTARVVGPGRRRERVTCAARRRGRAARRRCSSATRAGRSGDVGAGVRPPGRGAGEVGGDARSRAGGGVTAIVGALQHPAGRRARTSRRWSAIERASFTDPWTPTRSPRRCARAHAGAGRRGGREVRRGWRGEAAGLCCRAWSPGPEAEIADLAVAPDARRRGIGRALLDRLLAELARAGVLGGLSRGSRVEPRRPRALRVSRDSRASADGGGTIGIPVEDALLLKRELGPT